MVVRLHVDEVHDDNPSHVPEPQLACDLFCGELVDLEGILFLVGGLGADAAVHVDHIQRFRRLDHKIGPLPHGHHLSEGTLDLPGDLEMVVDRLLALVQVYDLLLLGGNEGDVFPGFVADFLVVDPDVGERVVQQVPEDGGRLAVLREEQLDSLVPGDLLPGALPLFDEGLGLSYEGGRVLAFGRRADNGPVILREDALDKRLESTLLLFRRNLLRDAHLFGEREKDTSWISALSRSGRQSSGPA